MTAFAKGDFVLTNRAGTSPFVRRAGRAAFSKDEELLVTSTGAGWVNVKRANNTGPVFWLSLDDVRHPARRLGEVPEGSLPADDPRIAWMFEDAMRLADRLGLCSDFDRIADALGVPGRTRTFSIKVVAAEGIEITAKVEARSRKLAEQLILDRMHATTPPQIRALNQGAHRA
ncbi:hypothetical protein [Herbiconiux sp. VKM Ac-2851]|uniref:hypothetical protein n=1 Tax=Herbiconiux sp. VKM Ac-2851 TaxID=2739025 RepID=UPI00156442A3|nr:hypothetical protein [Herbiconiux sp. VKM Ac-2851]NQX36271.1 hypothetical protein [Herbiconiux sp. VKM Ac-2851]